MGLFALACSSPAKGPSQPAATEQVDPEKRMVADMADLHFDRLGNPVLRWDHIPPVLAKKERPHKLLVLLVEFQDRGFDRFAGDPDQNQKLADWYQNYLFDDSYQRVDTISHYYATQSLGAYHVSGKVMPPLKLSKGRRDYGSPHRPAGGDWRNDVDPEGAVKEALALAKTSYPELAWTDFDRWDPLDFDGDKTLDEPDGYIDHFVLVFAGSGQSSCEGLHKLRQVLTPNVGMEGLDTLSEAQRECGDRIWAHRSNVKANDGRGPALAGHRNPLGGQPLSDNLWIRDYNMQSEYTERSTFIHEFGHSIGLPDIYSRTSSNSTGSWEVMSATTGPSPQNMSAWSRLMLGWLKPKVIVPPAFGGAADDVVDLVTLDDPAGAEQSGATRAAMIVLPPKTRDIDLTTLPERAGKWALYSGQGNELERTAEVRADLSAASGKLELSFDAWWEIEGGWDFAYVEASIDDGESWHRLLPTDRRYMPAKHGHDGKNTLPGLTGISGDLDGDGKNESNTDCDPKQEVKHGEDSVGADKSPCLVPSWVRPAFDLSSLAGKKVRVRVRYYTDMAAVMRGILIDNVQISGLGDKALDGDFEDDDHSGWTLKGFSKSAGAHKLLVPHFYLVEHRDPYASKAGGAHRYDRAMADESYVFYADPKSGQMMAVDVRPRPGVVVWYYNGAYAWSENDPAINGPGKGYLLALDSNHNELTIPGLEGFFSGTTEARDTHYDVSSEAAQKTLETAYTQTICFVRKPSYLPKRGLSANTQQSLGCGQGKAPLSKLRVGDRSLRYSYEIVNEMLPGPERNALIPAGELYDTRIRKGKLSYRLRDRSLRHAHTYDAPLSLEPFAEGVLSYRVTETGLEKVGAKPHPAQPSFTDANPERWMNSKLPFGGVVIPKNGLSLQLEPVPADAPAGTKARVRVSWSAE